MLPSDLDPPDRRLPALRWAVGVLLALGLGACIAKGADAPADPELREARIDGFGEIVIRVEPAVAPRTASELCALLAATSDQRARGLMRVTDLRGYTGMVFRFENDTSGGFWMKDTPMPLSIAFFAADGSFVSAADMEPCLDRGSDCPSYGATRPYRYALEVPQGQLDDLGIGPGSRLVLAGPCGSA